MADVGLSVNVFDGLRVRRPGGFTREQTAQMCLSEIERHFGNRHYYRDDIRPLIRGLVADARRLTNRPSRRERAARGEKFGMRG